MIAFHPGHDIYVTTADVRVYVDCSCGLERRFASKPPAVRFALEHHHQVGGCNCPPDVVALDVHPIPGPGQPAPVASVA